jgi:hypothetical protein
VALNTLVFFKVLLEVLRENTGAIDMLALFPDIRLRAMLNAQQPPRRINVPSKPVRRGGGNANLRAQWLETYE